MRQLNDVASRFGVKRAVLADFCCLQNTRDATKYVLEVSYWWAPLGAFHHSPSSAMFMPSTSLAEPPVVLNRSHIVAVAQTLYFQDGIATVSMADVAARLDQPESIVLAAFPAGKEALVQAVLESHAHQMHAELEQLHQQCTTAVEELLALRVLVSQKMGQGNMSFFQETEAQYPTAWRQWQAQRGAFMLDYVRANLRQGIAQELYYEGLDVEFLARLWQQQMRNLRTVDDEGLSPARMHYTLVAHFLAGIVTPTGAYVARRLQEAEPYY